MVKFHGFSKRKAVYKSIKPTLAIDFIEQPSHPVSFINQLPYAVLDKNVLWLSISEQDINFPTSLTNELRLFSDYVKLDEQEEEARNILLHDVEITTQSVFPNAYIEAFGSFPVGLSTFLSDLDVTILGVDQPRAQQQGCVEMKDGSCGTAVSRADRGNKRSSEGTGVKMGSDVSVKFRNEDDRVMRLIHLEQVYTAIQVYRRFLRSLFVHSMLSVLYLHCQSCSWAHKTDLWRRARVPIIHLTHRNSVQCDVCIDMPQHSTLAVVRGLQERSGPALFVLSAFLKIFLKQLSLDMPFTGGLGSYKLYVLIAKHIERHPDHVADKQAPRLGELLLGFLEFYGDRRNLHADVVVEMEGAETVSFERTSKVYEIRMAFEKAHSVLRGAEHRRQQRLLSGKEDAAAVGAESRRLSGSMLAGLLNTAHLARLRNQLRARCHRYLSHRAVSCSAGKSHSSMGQSEGAWVDREEGEVSEDNSYEDRAEGAAVDQEHQLAVLKSRLRDRIRKSKRGRSSPMRLSASDGTACVEGAHMGGCSSGGGSVGSSDDELSGDSDTDENSTGGSWALHEDSASGQGGNREEEEVSEYSEEREGEESEEGEAGEGGYESEPAESNIASSSEADQERQLALLKARLRDRLGQSKNSQGQAALANSDLPLPESDGVVGAEKDAISDGSLDSSDDEHSGDSGTDRAAWALRRTGGWPGSHRSDITS